MSVAERSIFCAGYVALDIVVQADKVTHAAGGTAANVAAILGFLGWDSSVVGEIGNDAAGLRVKQDLRAANVSIQYLRSTANCLTPSVVHWIEPGGHHFAFVCPKCGIPLPRSRPLTLAQARAIQESAEPPDVYFLDRLNAGTLLLAEHFSEKGSLVVFEPSRPYAPKMLDRILKIANIVKSADDRTTGIEDQPTTNRNQIRIVTHGAKGASHSIGEGEWKVSRGFSYPTVDAGGAGDWLTAGLLSALDPNAFASSIEDAMTWAQALAAVSCGSPGARGLARQQSAQHVVRSVSFLQQHGQPVVPRSHEQNMSHPPKVSLKECGYCLRTKRELIVIDDEPCSEHEKVGP